ncbi:terpenoid synthase [Aspergillus sclerotiicarbonarius CBS 121057]|uniref:Terpenoid synthase n=1 Tax=Aspergillus sclerotiicarbonarius (strain CBS 121057 / IBT 28362) TaxID=1448318 RepID=A0A319E0N1_ASPSB|nr:terpenoid synthase [Aspergillus sclerotiicarbonarius CBS 121057]
MDLTTNKLLFIIDADRSGHCTGPSFLLFNVLIFFSMTIFAAALKQAIHRAAHLSEKIFPGGTISKREYEDIVNGFLRDISFQPPVLEFDSGLKSRLENRLESYGISRRFITEIEPCINTATKISSCSYPFVSPEVLEAIALYATYVISIDDMTSEILPDLENYGSQLILGRPPRHELLRGFTNQDGVRLSRDASDYLVFFRAKTGVAEPFAFFCFPEDTNPEDQDLAKYISAIPSIMLFLGYVNDLLSFYKEELKEGDSPGFIQSYAKVHGSNSLQALRQLRHNTIEEVRKIRSILSDDDFMAQRINQFIHGYILYHLCAGRYRLAELNVPAAHEARRRFQDLAKV